MRNERVTEKFLRQLWEFLKEARVATYASGAKPVTPRDMPGFKMFVHGDSKWCYTDTFAGSRLFGGREIVWFEAEPAWYMNYGGGFVGNPRCNRSAAQRAYEALKLFLLQIRDSEEFQPRSNARGSIIGAEGWRYHCRQIGTESTVVTLPWDIRGFQGQESLVNLRNKHTPHHVCRFHGGLLID